MIIRLVKKQELTNITMIKPYQITDILIDYFKEKEELADTLDGFHKELMKSKHKKLMGFLNDAELREVYDDICQWAEINARDVTFYSD